MQTTYGHSAQPGVAYADMIFRTEPGQPLGTAARLGALSLGAVHGDIVTEGTLLSGACPFAAAAAQDLCHAADVLAALPERAPDDPRQNILTLREPGAAYTPPVPGGALAVVRVPGGRARLRGAYGGCAQRTLYVFPEAREIALEGADIAGSFLAPRARVLVTGDSSITGTLVAGELTAAPGARLTLRLAPFAGGMTAPAEMPANETPRADAQSEPLAPQSGGVTVCVYRTRRCRTPYFTVALTNADTGAVTQQLVPANTCYTFRASRRGNYYLSVRACAPFCPCRPRVEITRADVASVTQI